MTNHAKLRESDVLFFVYFVRDETSELVKVGCTAQFLHNRNLGIQPVGGAKRCQILAAFPAFEREAEYVIHWMLDRYRSHGEWFTIGTEEIYAVIIAWTRDKNKCIRNYEKACAAGWKRHRTLRECEPLKSLA